MQWSILIFVDRVHKAFIAQEEAGCELFALFRGIVQRGLTLAVHRIDIKMGHFNQVCQANRLLPRRRQMERSLADFVRNVDIGPMAHK